MKMGLLLIYLAALGVVFLYRAPVSDWLLHHHPPMLLGFAIALGLVLFPVLPYKLVIGMLGAVYGPIWGAVLSWSAATLASIVVFQLARTCLMERGRQYISRFKQLGKLHILLERHPFLAIFAARLVPVFPQALVNIYPAFLSIRLRTYVSASALGKIPGILMYAYLGNQLFANPHHALMAGAVYAAFLAVALLLYRLWARHV